jgi:predicted SAM-dependent methyltransferase
MEEKVNNAKKEFEKYLKKFAIKDNRFGNGIDIGCGTNRIDDMILSIDQQANWKYANAQIVWDCKNLELFNDNVLDFIFSSHVLEDFDDIPGVFLSWWRKLKVGGKMLLLVPDIQGGRYPKCGEPGANPSHKTDVGKKYFNEMLDRLKKEGKIKYKILQQDTIPHNESSSIDFVIERL